MAYVALRANIIFEAWVAGWSLAVCEAKINRLADCPMLLQHELEYWRNRHDSYGRSWWRITVLIILAVTGVAYAAASIYLWRNSPRHTIAGAWLPFAGVVVSTYLAVAHRVCMLVIFASDPDRDTVIKDAKNQNEGFRMPAKDKGRWWRALLGFKLVPSCSSTCVQSEPPASADSPSGT